MRASTHYEVLAVRQSATLGQVRSAYKRMALLLHPDKNTREQLPAQLTACSAAQDAALSEGSRCFRCAPALAAVASRPLSRVPSCCPRVHLPGSPAARVLLCAHSHGPADPDAAAAFEKVMAANETLCSPRLRAQYDFAMWNSSKVRLALWATFFSAPWPAAQLAPSSCAARRAQCSHAAAHAHRTRHCHAVVRNAPTALHVAQDEDSDEKEDEGADERARASHHRQPQQQQQQHGRHEQPANERPSGSARSGGEEARQSSNARSGSHSNARGERRSPPRFHSGRGQGGGQSYYSSADSGAQPHRRKGRKA